MKQNNRIICKNGADNVAKTTNDRQGAFWSYLQLSMSHQVQEKYAKLMQSLCKGSMESDITKKELINR